MQTQHLTFTADAFLFDMDGTLVDSTAVSERVWRTWAASQNVAADAVLAYSHGRRTLDTTRRFTASEEEAFAAAQAIEAEEVAAEDGTIAIEGARELLESLPDARWAVVTSAGPLLAARRLAAAGLPVPAVLITAGDVTKGKPEPEGYLLAARRLGRNPSRCLVFEDTFAGHEAARRANMRSINRLAVPHDHEGPLLTISDYLAVTARADTDGLTIELNDQSQAAALQPVSARDCPTSRTGRSQIVG